MDSTISYVFTISLSEVHVKIHIFDVIKSAKVKRNPSLKNCLMTVCPMYIFHTDINILFKLSFNLFHTTITELLVRSLVIEIYHH
jgi:hypothetical protein